MSRDTYLAQWAADPALRAEFTSAENYAAYQSAMARGLVKIQAPSKGLLRTTTQQFRAEAAAPARAVLLREGGVPALRLSAGLALASAGAALPSRFSGTAYSGGLVPDFGIVIDLASTSYKRRIPLLENHRREVVVGVIEQAATTSGRMTVSGRLFSDLPGSAAERIAQLAQRGAPYEMSVGLYAFDKELVLADKSVIVNGANFTGPLTVLRNGQVREVSIVVLGADPGSAASFH